MGQSGKTVLVGVSGCIAAYKACEIVRSLQKDGFDVRVVMTENATEFVGVATFEALTGFRAPTRFFIDGEDPIPHITLADEADLFLIAPCTANVLAKLSCGIADDLLTTTALAATCPLVIAPAMNVHMYENVITQENIAKLKARGVSFVEPGDGYLACGDVGRGRLAEPDEIVAFVKGILLSDEVSCAEDLAGKRILITAGPTVEPIDPVRFISNRSSGKMGYSIAECALARGAEVVLVSGPVDIDAPEGAQIVHVMTADEMLRACEDAFVDCDVAICAAAVSDFKVDHVSSHKIKKDADESGHRNSGIDIKLVENADILKTLASTKHSGQTVVGFAAETDDVIGNAKKKLASKGADMIVANKVGFNETFGKDDIEASFVCASGVQTFRRMPKKQLADAILDHILK